MKRNKESYKTDIRFVTEEKPGLNDVWIHFWTVIPQLQTCGFRAENISDIQSLINQLDKAIENFKHSLVEYMTDNWNIEIKKKVKQ